MAPLITMEMNLVFAMELYLILSTDYGMFIYTLQLILLFKLMIRHSGVNCQFLEKNKLIL